MAKEKPQAMLVDDPQVFCLQHTATHRDQLQRMATHCNALSCTATHCNALQRTATHCNALQRSAMLCNAHCRYPALPACFIRLFHTSVDF